MTHRTAFIAGLLSLSAAVPAAGDRLLDQDREPVADAWVVATRRECIGPGHCSTYCVEVIVAKTDRSGEYDFASGLLTRDAYGVTAYREGYVARHRQAGRRVELSMERGASDPRFASLGPTTDRIAYLADAAIGMRCSMAPSTQRQGLLPVYKAMFREARSIARYPEQHKLAREICREMYGLAGNPMDASEAPDVERARQERYLSEVEPACNVPLDDGNEREIALAVQSNDVSRIRAAAREGFDFNRRLDGRNPLIIVATMKGHAEMVAELLAGGAKADESAFDGKTTMDYALSVPRARRLAVVQALLQGGADANRQGAWSIPPIVQVSRELPGDVQLFKLLARHGARVDQRVKCDCLERGSTVLYLAQDPALVRIAIELGANPNDRLPAPLMNTRPPAVMRLLLDHGADPNVAEINGLTPLMVAIQRYEGLRDGYKQVMGEVAELLVAAGARLETRDARGFDAFHFTNDEALKSRLRMIAQSRKSSSGVER